MKSLTRLAGIALVSATTLLNSGCEVSFRTKPSYNSGCYQQAPGCYGYQSMPEYSENGCSNGMYSNGQTLTPAQAPASTGSPQPSAAPLQPVPSAPSKL
jgi:hypothetical protein